MTTFLIAMNTLMAMFAVAALGTGAFVARSLTAWSPHEEGRADWRGPS